jgi:RNA polymerase sigma factor (sigma-70 family)
MGCIPERTNMFLESEEYVTAPDVTHDWIDRLKALESVAWDDAITFCGDDLRRDIRSSLNKRGLPTELAGDIEQETWAVVVEKIHCFEYSSIDKFQHWLRVIALNRVRMFKRRSHGTWLSYDELEDGDFDGNALLDFILFKHDLGHEDPAAEFDRKELLAALEQALRVLKPRDAEILIRRVVFDEAPRDLAQVYGLAPRSVSMVLLRAKELLEQYLNRHLNVDILSTSGEY